VIQVIRETHETPESVARALRFAGGSNRFGEANYRAVWGWNRLAWIGGKFEDRDEHGRLIREVVQLRMEPKYPQVNRWHIERWCPPESYGSPRSWYAQTIEWEAGKNVPALGPYPTRGDYEHCFTLETPKGEFVQLTPTVARYIASAIEFSRGERSSARKVAINRREAKEDLDYENWAYDVMDDACPAFGAQPFVSVI
jgi:hypothetical protein